MSWATDLWDQYDSVASYTQRGIDFIEKYGTFLDKYGKIEQEYAMKLRQLVKVYSTKKSHIGELEEQELTCHKAFRKLLNEHNDMAGQHEVIAENINNLVLDEVKPFVKTLKYDRKKYFQDATQMQSQLQVSRAALNKSKDKYHKSQSVEERARREFLKADADMNLSRADVEKHRSAFNIKSKECNDLKAEYMNQLQYTTDAENEYYNQNSPKVLQCLQEWDEKRINGMSEFIQKSIEVQRKVVPIINKCYEEVESAAKSMDYQHDAQAVIDMFKSGFIPPNQTTVNNITNDSEISVISNLSSSSKPMRSYPSHSTLIQDSTHEGINVVDNGDSSNRSVFGTMTRKKSGKFGTLKGMFRIGKEDYLDLPPNQGKKKVLSKLNEIQQKVSQETAVKDGLIKMKQVYGNNPTLGDPLSLENQLSENENQLKKLFEREAKYENILKEIEKHGGAGDVRPANSKPSLEDYQLEKDPINGHNNYKTLLAPHYDNSGSEFEDNSSFDATVLPSALEECSSYHNTNNIKESNSSPENIEQRRNVSKVNISHNKHDQDSELRSNTKIHQEESDNNNCVDVNKIDLQSALRKFSQDGFTMDKIDKKPQNLIKCKALYPFESTGDGSISMQKNEEFWIIDKDEGDGWTKVKRIYKNPFESMIEGYVPTSYITPVKIPIKVT